MELHLTYDEEEFRKLYEDGYNAVLKAEGIHLREHKDITAHLSLGAVTSFLLGFFSSKGWLFLTGTSLFLMGFFWVRSILARKSNEKLIREHRKQVEAALSQGATPKKVKYVYDDRRVAYYIDDEFHSEFFWKDVKICVNHQNFIQLSLDKDHQQYILVPRAMAPEEEYLCFRDTVIEQTRHVKQY